MVTKALYVVVEARPGRETDAEQFLRDALAMAQAEPQTTVWFALRIGRSTFGIFDAFPDETGREAHLDGRIAAGLKEKVPELFIGDPLIERIDVLAAKLPR
ncbi:putative quinol monooxygenase [Propylenella binzhouense]|uniref:Antibiotic biosynthesis monooxygenase n=1 Tax=Propylenella binzhouense TaxID=2555902 RepID=A0A964T2B2_9HYPH|nr:antibiotic biosynthesis monooxygenase [Propylenella binzhouense]MYZ46619.1 antibiotic biosynthesis monooxygenase [Propylenella binzhouense]